MTPRPVFSQRYLRNGPLVEESYRLFGGWRDAASIDENFDEVLRDRFPTVAQVTEVRTTISGRLRNLDAMRPLIVLARNGMRLQDWRDCRRLWIGATEEPFGSFVRDWLFPQFSGGRYQVTADSAREFAINAWNAHSPKRSLSQYGVVRAARDLVRTAARLGMLAGAGPIKTFAASSMSDDVLLFYVQLIADLEGSPTKVPDSPLWRLALMPASEAHVTLLHLHQSGAWIIRSPGASSN